VKQIGSELKLLLVELAKKITSSEAYFHSVNTCIALCGLQNTDDNVPEVKTLLTALLDKAIDASEQGIDRATDREISMALYGLQKMGGLYSPIRSGSIGKSRVGGVATAVSDDGENNNELEAPTSNPQYRKGNKAYYSANNEKDYIIQEVSSGPTTAVNAYNPNAKNKKASLELRRALSYIKSLMQYQEGPFEAKRLAFATCGLASVSCDIPEALEVIAELAKKSKDAWGDVTGHELGMCLHGLSGMRSDLKPVRELLQGLAPVLRRCPNMRSTDVASAFLGLKGIRSGSKEVSEFIDAFADLIERSVVDGFIQLADTSELCDVMYGIQGLNSEFPETKKLYRTVAKLISGVTVQSAGGGTGEGRFIAGSLYGLKSSSSKDVETTLVIRALTEKFKQYTGGLTVQHVALALNGLQGVSSGHPGVKELLEALTPLVANATGEMNPKGVAMAIYGLQVNPFSPIIRGIDKLFTS